MHVLCRGKTGWETSAEVGILPMPGYYACGSLTLWIICRNLNPKLAFFLLLALFLCGGILTKCSLVGVEPCRECSSGAPRVQAEGAERPGFKAFIRSAEAGAMGRVKQTWVSQAVGAWIQTLVPLKYGAGPITYIF